MKVLSSFPTLLLVLLTVLQDTVRAQSSNPIATGCCTSYDGSGNSYTTFGGGMTPPATYDQTEWGVVMIYDSNGILFDQGNGICYQRTTPAPVTAVSAGSFSATVVFEAAVDLGGGTAPCSTGGTFTMTQTDKTTNKWSLSYTQTGTGDVWTGTLYGFCADSACSSSSSSNTESGGIACFSGDATVTVQDRGVVSMRELHIGDRVLDKDGTYTPIYAFGHRSNDMGSNFLQIHTTTNNNNGNATDNNMPLEISQQHLLFKTERGRKSPLRADAIRIGDVLHGLDDGEEELSVTEVNNVRKQGVYAPFTKSGTLLVDGVLASSYISLQDYQGLEGPLLAALHHDQIHWAISPIRVLCMNAVSSTSTTSLCNSYDPDGVAQVFSVVIKVIQFAQTQNSLVQWILALAYLLLLGLFLLLETIFGSEFALVGGVLLLFCSLLHHQTQRKA